MRLDKLYDEIEEIETFIEAVETRLYNIKQEKISSDNVYQFLLFFDNLYDRFTDMEKKIFMKSFLEEGNIYEAEQEDGRILRSLKFRFPVFFNEQELYELDWDNESTVETVCLLVLRNPVTHINIDVDVEELVQDKRGAATYGQIKDYVLEHSGLKVSSLYIAQVKQKCGIIERENYNKPKSEDAKQPQCPPEKEKAIRAALQHFRLIEY